MPLAPSPRATGAARLVPRAAGRARARALLLALAGGCAACAQEAPGTGSARGAAVERLATGLGFTEGPLWDPARGGLLFSALDRPLAGDGGRILFLDGAGTLTTERAPSGNANGLAFAPDGALLAAEHASRSVTRRDPASGRVTTLLAGFAGGPLNAPNDLAVRADGTLYATDPDLIGPPPPRPGFEGLYRLAPGAAEAQLEARLAGPNGVALAPDERTLYVSETRNGRVLAFPVEPSGALGPARELARDLPLADGLAVGPAGELLVATAVGARGAIAILAPDGTRRGAIALPEPARNCALGGADGATLFATAGGSVYAVRGWR